MDGNDVTAVYEVAAAAVSRARAGEGPSLIECKTYRSRTHTERRSAEDPRPPDEVEAWRRRDPIKRLVADLMGQAVLDDEAWQIMNDEISQEIKAAVKFAEDSPFPEPKDALEDVFAQ